MASSNIIPCSPVEQVRTNLLSDDHDGDGSHAPQQESEYFFYCKLQTEPSVLLCHTFSANNGDLSLYTDLSGLHASTDIVRHVHYYYQ